MIFNTRKKEHTDFSIEEVLDGKLNRTFFYKTLAPDIIFPEAPKILDIGCNNAITYRILSSLWKQILPEHKIDYSGLDLDADLLSQNKKEFPECSFVQADFTKTIPELAPPYDVVFCTEVFSILPCFKSVIEYAVQQSRGLIIFDLLMTRKKETETTQIPLPSADLVYQVWKRKDILAFLQEQMNLNKDLHLVSCAELPVMDMPKGQDDVAMDSWFVFCNDPEFAVKSPIKSLPDTIPLHYFSKQNREKYGRFF